MSHIASLIIDKFCTIIMVTDKQQSKEKSKFLYLIIDKFCTIIMLTAEQKSKV
jgi:hypothetical protein